MRALIAAAAAAAAVALAGGCASTPTSFYTLSSTVQPAAQPSPFRLSVSVGPVSIPAMVDRPQLVLSSGANQVLIDEFNRWAAPLGDEITRVTVQNLTLLLGTTEVWPATAASRADVKLRIDILSFTATPGEAVVIDARWSVRRGDAESHGRSLQREPTRGPGVDLIAAAYSRALARSAADIATAIRAP